VRRFALVYVLLVLAVAGAAVAAALVGGKAAPHHRVTRQADVPWSPWHPVASSTSPPVQIALHTMRQYLLRDGNEFVHVVTSEPRWQGAPIVAAAVVGELGGESQFTPTSDADTVMYSLCGPANDCSLPTSPSTAPAVLITLERQGLELALNTFHYLAAARNVFVTMPPGTVSGPTVLFWRRADLAAPLAKPLAATIKPYAHSQVRLTRHDVDVVDTYAAPFFDGVDAQKTADGNVLFVLKRLPVP